jgi:predicted metalloprotease with PDZ domain
MKLPLALAALPLAACASLASLPSPDPPEIVYTIELRQEPALEARFTLEAPAGERGPTTFEVDADWGGVEDAADQVENVRAVDASGANLVVDHPERHRWLVQAAPGDRITVSWSLAPNAFQADTDPRVHYRSILNEHLLHVIGNLGLLEPELPDDAPRRIAVRWKGFREAGWTVASSFSLDADGFEVVAPVQAVRHAVYLAGRIRTRVVEVRGRDVAVAIAGEAWPWTDEAFLENVRAIVETERAFFDDDRLPYYLVSVIPVGAADPNSRSLGGTGLSQSFALFLQEGTPLGTHAGGGLDVPWLLAHEMFHHWNGQTVSMEAPEQLVYWFSEGFTDFFARRVMARAGFGGVQEYARNVNRKLREYTLSPAREEPNEAIREGFWRSRDVGQLPYQRGDVVAMLCDRAIFERSGGARSLDDFMREVVEAGRRGEQVSTERLLARIEAWTDSAFAQRVREIVVEGRTAEIPPDTFAPCFEVELVEMGAFDPGFEVDASRRAKSVRGVRKGSAAERAGLRDGQSLLGWSVSFGRPDVPIEMQVREDGEEKAIRWLPQGEPLLVPQVRAVEGADCSGL